MGPYMVDILAYGFPHVFITPCLARRLETLGFGHFEIAEKSSPIYREFFLINNCQCQN
jgi:hypothetical protein